MNIGTDKFTKYIEYCTIQLQMQNITLRVYNINANSYDKVYNTNTDNYIKVYNITSIILNIIPIKYNMDTGCILLQSRVYIIPMQEITSEYITQNSANPNIIPIYRISYKCKMRTITAKCIILMQAIITKCITQLLQYP